MAGGLIGAGAKRLLNSQAGYKDKMEKLLPVLDSVAAARGVSRVAIALAWLLKHPARIIPIVGSTVPERIKDAAVADGVDLTREEWYRILLAARGEPLP